MLKTKETPKENYISFRKGLFHPSQEQSHSALLGHFNVDDDSSAFSRGRKDAEDSCLSNNHHSDAMRHKRVLENTVCPEGETLLKVKAKTDAALLCNS